MKNTILGMPKNTYYEFIIVGIVLNAVSMFFGIKDLYGSIFLAMLIVFILIAFFSKSEKMILIRNYIFAMSIIIPLVIAIVYLVLFLVKLVIFVIITSFQKVKQLKKKANKKNEAKRKAFLSISNKIITIVGIIDIVFLIVLPADFSGKFILLMMLITIITSICIRFQSNEKDKLFIRKLRDVFFMLTVIFPIILAIIIGVLSLIRKVRVQLF